jgi:hypothetical protein
MIVYSGKQFWNNFNNGDDAVFGDSNRPRDENGFKLRPWLQGDKWSFRDVNKKTNFSDINIKWWSDIATTPVWQDVKMEIPTIKKTWNWKDDWVSIGYPSWYRDPEAAAMDAYSNELHNDPQYKLVEWDFAYHHTTTETKTKHTVCIEIVETWLYYVESFWQFYFSYNNPWSYDSTNAYKYKERVFIMKYNDKQQQFTPTELCNYRAVWNGDWVTLTRVLWLKSWERLLPWAALQQPNWTNGVQMCLHLVRLW